MYHTKNSTKLFRRDMERYYLSFCSYAWNDMPLLKIDNYELHVYTLKSKETTKIIKQRVICNNQNNVELSFKYSICWKEGKKRRKRGTENK